MAMIEISRPAPFGAISIFQVSTALTNLVAALSNPVRIWVENRRTALELSRLSPAMLQDIGLSSADVQAYRVRGGLI